MRRNFAAIASVGTALLLAACESDHLTTTATSGLTPRHGASASLSLTCNFTTLPNLGHLYFPDPYDQVFGLITQMSAATSADTRTSLGFDILTRLAMFRYDPANGDGLYPGTPETGGAFAKAVVACMDLGTIPDSFDPVAALRNGIFEVRGSDATAGAALAYTGSSNGAKVEVSPRYGVEPRTVAGWPTSTGPGAPRYLIYGYPTAGDFAGETPKDGFNAFEVGSLRADLAKDKMRVGICEKLVVASQNNPAQGVAANILIHSDQMIANESPNFCATQSSASASRSWLTRVASIFRPSIAFAQDPEGGLSRDFIGGGPSSWSPMSWSKVAGSDMNLAFKKQPKNTDKSDAIPEFIVHVQSDAGNGIPGVQVTVSVDKNKGVPAGAIVSGTITVATNASGDAIFTNVFVGKAGGYRLDANGSLGGVHTNDATSSLFNVKNK